MKRFAMFLLVSLFFGLSLGNSLCVYGNNEASSAIEEAKSSLQLAFKAVWEAEIAGADVSSLISELNEAGELLANAHKSYQNMDFNEAVLKANQCSVLANVILDDAVSLKGSVLADTQKAFWFSFTFSAFTITTFIVLLILVWVRFKHTYSKKLLEMKPEVASYVET